MTSVEVRDQLQAFAQAIVEADEAGLRAFLSDDYSGHARAPGEPSQADRWVALLPELVAAIPDLAVAIEDVAVDGEVVHLRAVVTGTHTGELWGVQPSGASIRLELPVTLRDTGRRWTVNVEAEPSAIVGTLRQMGIVPPADQMHLPLVHPTRIPEFVLKLAFTGRAADKPCAHVAEARVFQPSSDACGECVATGGFWPALRMCLTCGFVGCCDTAVNKHMKAHHEATGHPVIRSIRLEEGWAWCYEDAAFFERATLERLAAEAGA